MHAWNLFTWCKLKLNPAEGYLGEEIEAVTKCTPGHWCRYPIDVQTGVSHGLPGPSRLTAVTGPGRMEDGPAPYSACLYIYICLKLHNFGVEFLNLMLEFFILPFILCTHDARLVSLLRIKLQKILINTARHHASQFTITYILLSGNESWYPLDESLSEKD